MKSNRKFLVPLAALVSIVVAPPISANLDNPVSAPERAISESMNSSVNNATTPNENDLFKFVLKRTGAGVTLADHESHYSHESHSSHVSHHSHYSGY